ncbi:MAG: hypothetical protein L0Z07_05320, partial [Planctomycetes bacterium]|nr:hypothetical protein [Planctomycetota bacterium]
GIGTGQLYLAGDGRLMHWDIFNQHLFSGYGATNYEYRTVDSSLQQGFAVRAQTGEQVVVRSLDIRGFPGVRFAGEYPIGYVEYQDSTVPVAVTLEAFSPFVPLNAADSALPATVMHFTVKNTSQKAVDVTLAGWLENGVGRISADVLFGVRSNRVIQSEGLTMILGSAHPSEPPKELREPVVLADFESDGYRDWTIEGEAFGKGPAGGTLEGQQEVLGFAGKGLVNTFLGGDRSQGKLVSPPFMINRSFLTFLLGGGEHPGETCVNLVVDGQVVRTATGKNQEKLDQQNWNVRDLAGKEGRIEIVDRHADGWGHINVDQIELRDVSLLPVEGPFESQIDFGTMGLALLDTTDVLTSSSLPPGTWPDALFTENGLAADNELEKPFGTPLCGALGKQFHLEPGQQQQVTFSVVWCFPNRPERGNFYATRFSDAVAVAEYLAQQFDRLAGQTRSWHQTWYDSTLPHWLLDRLFSTTSTLATSTCQWWKNGRFWAWEGVGCCHGTCAHVWNYEHTMARLFPELERTVREMQDFNPQAGFDEKTGAIRFRGEDWEIWAGDSQGGTVLKAYREHQVSADDAFLRRNWPRIRKTLEFLIQQDGNADGLIEGSQHNTYDIDFFGSNTMVGSLYLAALRAAEEMAEELGEKDFAATCRQIYERGREETVKQLFNGEYFVQKVDLAKYPKHQYANGCLADQLFGQGWAHQVGIGYVYPRETIQAALKSIWIYNWAPDIGPQNEAHPPQRWFARPGEAGLFTCTWPKGKHLGPESVLYRDEVWTGIEYQVAGNLVWDGMLTEALAICRGVHERYHPSKHNPFNEIECGDHYARGMASYGVFLALCGFEYHGPKGHLGFSPRMTPDDFRAAFTAAEGWGTFAQSREPGKQINRLDLKWGHLNVRTIALELPEGAIARSVAITAAGNPVEGELQQEGCRVVITLNEPLVVQAGDMLETRLITG